VQQEMGHARVVQQSPKAGCRCEVSLGDSTKMAAGGFSRTWTWRAEAAVSLPTLAGKGSAQSSV
jgi:hypothetical protein